MKIVLSTRARRDLEGIRLYIEKDNPTRAVAFIDELRDAARRIADMPRAMNSMESGRAPSRAMASSIRCSLIASSCIASLTPVRITTALCG
ncbi:type II toxin-antitoxin system RelE/ParE family toxin [Novosphingobium panipatense]|uniref:ParE toxin of type II toxin-antitoxin system, parDE n=1 Tax=Novosphingobium panipatense TaxID=428991 RepID=A0ABY1QYX6_9SPHN|nr:ParE toxin of type II toxin-antitoxin system, parDE [Novosphingobium panipatense]